MTMKKHPSCFKLQSPLSEMNAAVGSSAVTLYDGPVRGLCPLAPNNVNTMAAAAVAAHNLGFDGVQGCLVSDPQSVTYHFSLIIASYQELQKIPSIHNGESQSVKFYNNSFRIRTGNLNRGITNLLTESVYLSLL